MAQSLPLTHYIYNKYHRKLLHPQLILIPHVFHLQHPNQTIAQVLLIFLLLSQHKLLNMKYFRPVGNIHCHFKSKQIATKWNGPQNFSCLPVFANCHSKILKFSTQRKFGTSTNSKTYNFTDPRPYLKSSKKTTPISFFLKEKKPIL